MPAHILLVEDDDTLRCEILEYLLRRRYHVTACASIADATEALAHVVDGSIAPDTVISDIRLPDGDGVTFYAENARRFPNIKWILMSGNHDLVRQGNKIKGHPNLPGCAIVDKPMPLRLLDRVVQSSRRLA